MMDSVIDVRRSTKKVKRRTDESLDLDDLVVNEKGIRMDGVGTQLVSWKEKLMGSASTGANMHETLDADIFNGSTLSVKPVGLDQIAWDARRLAAFIDLEKLLVSKVQIDGKFQRVEYKDFVILFEIRINGCKADSIIAKLGFENSFRAEAIGFAEDIWLLWNDDIIVDILKVYTLFIHMRIWVDRN
ncbi:hypothetical protein Gohar_013372 [Gossypium harknessii]|uniref:Uncharacterized protein n=1 Tax=Gossypium harknessii TaxID=34285 RepID=A0A7J9H199_9ROSI|nr:hypothetical protein [Gossypium harknessii]